MHQTFWAKADRSGGSYKPVVHHLADVAATALILQEVNPARTRRDATITGLEPGRQAQVSAVFAGLHDIGKLSKSFQKKVPRLWPEQALGPFPATMTAMLNHWQATALLLNAPELRRALAPLTGDEGIDHQVIAAIAGHHGRAPEAKLVAADEWEAARHGEIGPACVVAAATLAAQLLAVVAPRLEPVTIRHPEDFSFQLNGLITLSDWIGSDSTFFVFEDPDMSLADYWPLALRRAEAAIEHKGLRPARSVRSPQLAAMSTLAQAPRPMQALAAAVPLGTGSQIVVIEDGTGSGKTEAALLIAARMMASGLGEGVFLAMPTMATANAMHTRLAAARAGLFDGPATMVLAHGKADLARAMARRDTAAGTDDSESARWCDAWIADSRKTALFASAGIGTIDQGFLAILPKKHLTLRQYALAGRILIVDEAHACDAYMGEELKVMIEMQARLGGSVIVLSATLTRKQRTGLIDAFARGRGLSHRARSEALATINSADYPLLTRYAPETGIEEHAVTGAPELARSVAIATLPSRAAVVAAARAAAAKGAAVAIVCNAVDPAVATYEDLVAAGASPERTHLFHARFAVADRLHIERNVQAWFGRASTQQERQGRILVATQVIEQSLDVDFDVMFTDLAPADLVVQRAGRLWRHVREGRPVKAPVLTLLTPDPAAVDTARWLDATLGAAAFVYDMPGVMWRTARDLVGKGRLDTPADLRPLIEAAYGTFTDDLPAPLRKGHEMSVGVGYGRQARARQVIIAPADGYAAVIAPSADEEIGTRDGAKSLTLRLARLAGDRLMPLAGDGDDALNWALSEVTVRANWLARFQRKDGVNARLAAPTAALRRDWPEFEQSLPVIAVSGDGSASSEDYEGLEYNRVTGLVALDTPLDVP